MKHTETQVPNLPTFAPAVSDQERDRQMASLAYNLAEWRMRNNTASSQEVCYFLKMGSRERQLELEQAEEENKLLRARTEALERERQAATTYEQVLEALQRYSGYSNDSEDDYEDPNVQ